MYRGDIDHVRGILLARDLWKAQREGVGTLDEIVREPTFVPASKPVERQRSGRCGSSASRW